MHIVHLNEQLKGIQRDMHNISKTTAGSSSINLVRVLLYSIIFFVNVNEFVLHNTACVHALKSEIMRGIFTALLAFSFMANSFNSNNRLKL